MIDFRVSLSSEGLLTFHSQPNFGYLSTPLYKSSKIGIYSRGNPEYYRPYQALYLKGVGSRRVCTVPTDNMPDVIEGLRGFMSTFGTPVGTTVQKDYSSNITLTTLSVKVASGAYQTPEGEYYRAT